MFFNCYPALPAKDVTKAITYTALLETLRLLSPNSLIFPIKRKSHCYWINI